MQFNNIVTHSGSFKLSVNKSGMSLDVLVFNLPSLGFLDANHHSSGNDIIKITTKVY